MDEQVRRHLRGIDLTLRTAALGGLLLLAVWALRDILLLVFAAVLMACVLRGASAAVHRRSGLPYGWSLLVVVLVIALTLGALLWWRGAAIGEQAAQITQRLTMQAQQLWHQLESTAWGSLVAERLSGAARSTGNFLTGYVPSVASSALGIGGSFVVVVATGLFLAATPELYLSGGLRLLPIGWRPRGRDVAVEIAKTLRLWFFGQFIDMVIVTTLVGAGLFLLDVQLALTLALFAGLLNFVPYVGALAGAAPAILVALSQSPEKALWVTLLFFGVQMLEGNVVAPVVQKRTIALPPALTILSQTILGTLLGALGLVLATPLMAALLTAVRMIYVEGVLEREHDGAPSPDEDRK